MVLDNKTTERIKSAVYQRPRSINEIAILIRKNWRTADRYVAQIAKTTGQINIKTFRGGTRGALKIVYWNNIEKIYSSSIQRVLFEKITSGKRKEDFSTFDLYQFVDKNKRHAYYKMTDEYFVDVKSMLEFLSKTEKEICVFSGNVSWINGEKGCLIKVLSRVDIVGLNNIEKILAINNRIRKEAIEVRHCFTPLRGFIVDNKACRLSETTIPQIKPGELSRKAMIFYEIYDEKWILWLKNLFWKLFQNAVPSEKRLDDIKSIKEIK
jgi:hypothetical protein